MQPDNHTIVMWGSKGGAGTSVTAAAAALHETNNTLLVDLDGDIAKILGTRTHDVGIHAWLDSTSEPERLTEFIDLLDNNTRLLQAGRPSTTAPTAERLEQLAQWIHQQPGIVIVDAGTGPPPAELAAIADKNVMVTRADYLALSDPDVIAAQPDQVILIKESHRSFRPTDIERAIGAPVTATIDVDPAIARAVDAGLFIGHRSLERGTKNLTDPSIAIGRPQPELDYGMNWTNSYHDTTFRLSYDPGTKQLTFTDNTTNERHNMATFDTTNDVDNALEGWATHHEDITDGLGWVQGQTAFTKITQTGMPTDAQHPPPAHQAINIDFP